MKNFPFFLLLTICVSCSNSDPGHAISSKDSQPVPVLRDTIEKDKPASGFLDLNTPKHPEEVRQIQLAVLLMDQQRFADSVYLENEDFLEQMTDGGGSLTGYFQNGRLVKINEWIGLSYGVVQRRFYFDQGQLIYVVEIEDDFYVDDSLGMDPSRFDMHFEGNYYFANKKMVDWISLGHNRFEDENLDAEKEYEERAAYLRKLILKKR